MMIVRKGNDITQVCMTIMKFAKTMGFSEVRVSNIGTVVSELGTNIIKYAGGGKISWNPVDGVYRMGLELIFEDEGDGIPNIDVAMKDGFSTGGTLGFGLPASRRMSDDFEIIKSDDTGTTIRSVLWLHK